MSTSCLERRITAPKATHHSWWLATGGQGFQGGGRGDDARSHMAEGRGEVCQGSAACKGNPAPSILTSLSSLPPPLVDCLNTPTPPGARCPCRLLYTTSCRGRVEYAKALLLYVLPSLLLVVLLLLQGSC